MPFVPFELERWQSEWEHRVPFNLSESGVHPLTLGELLALTDTDPSELDPIRLGYSQTDGSDGLREAVARLYPGAGPDNIIITIGSSEANFLACWTALPGGGQAAIQLPSYMQTWGLAKNLGARVSGFWLRRRDGRWMLDIDEMRQSIQPSTNLVVVTNPNNPTGHVLSRASADAVAARADEVGAWLLVDEVYRGAERSGERSPTAWGRTPRTLVTGGLSKAYGLPGLRIGWLVAPSVFIREAVQRHDYAVIGPSVLCDFLATRALSHGPALLDRTRSILNDNYPVLHAWLAKFDGAFEWTPPEAGAICFVRHHLGVDDRDLVEHLRARQGVLLVPGDHFDTPHHLRIGYGAAPDDLRQALAATEAGLTSLAAD
jgi:aspartate/methionine/tyrosine aminotransferase